MQNEKNAPVANLSQEELKRLEKFEEELGYALVAYEVGRMIQNPEEDGMNQ